MIKLKEYEFEYDHESNALIVSTPEGKVFTGWIDRLGVLHKASSEFTYETLDVCDELGSTKSARNTICASIFRRSRMIFSPAVF